MIDVLMFGLIVVFIVFVGLVIKAIMDEKN